MVRRLVRIVLLIGGFWLAALALLQVMGELDRQARAVTVTAFLLDDQAAAKIRRQNEAFDPELPVVRLSPPVDGHGFAALQIGFVDPDDLATPIPVQFDPDAPQTVVVDDPRATWALPVSFGIPAVVLLFIALVFLGPRTARLPSPPPLRRVGRPAQRGRPAPSSPEAALPPAAAAAAAVAKARSVVEHVSRRDTGARAVIDGPIVARTVRRPTTLAPVLAILVLLAGLAAIFFVSLAPGGP